VLAVTKAAEHLIAIPGSEWSFWRWVCVRSAGFPANGILKLVACPALIASADEVIKATKAMELAKERAIEEIRLGLDQLRASGQWDDKKKRKPLLVALTKIKANKVPQSLPEVVSYKSIEAWGAAIAYADTVRAAFHQKFSESTADTSEAIRKIARSASFCEALTWQNRAVVETAIHLLLREPQNGSDRNSQQRQHEELVANYWQRYCTKNDTIGFFGPVGWAKVTPESMHLLTRPGKQLLAARTTDWESWAIETVGEVLLQKYHLQRWIAPLLVPFVRSEGTLLEHPVFGRFRINARQAALLRACNGRNTAKQIAARLEQLPELHFKSEGEVYAELQELAERRWVFWKFNLPTGPHSERVLREALHRIEDLKLRKQSLDLLDELEAARTRVETSAGEPDKLNLALEFLEKLFTRITGSPATRSHGQAYAGRTLIYEDCRRDVEVVLGSDLLKPLVGPLSLLLAAGRWFTARVAETYRNKFLEIYSDLVKSTGTSTVDLSLCWVRLIPYFESASTLLAPMVEEFRTKWARVLELCPHPARINYSCDELRSRILKEFPPGPPGWASARYHSPDIMIAAASEEAIRQGDYFFVMGELHVGLNTLDSSLFGTQHPFPSDLINAVEHDLGALNIVPVGPRRQDAPSRMVPWLISKSNPRLEYLPDLFVTERSKALPISSIVVERHNNELIARTRDGNLRLRPLDLMGGLLGRLSSECFRIIAPGPHIPRVSIERLVIQRESWRFAPSELEFARCLDAAQRFLQAKKWVQELRIPRFVFTRVPVEKKPTFLDFESPILVDVFAKMIRRTLDAASPGSIDISEMLPTLDQIWLTDAHNERYTSEFRFVAVDPEVT
jgi:hypothetical protein